MRSVVLLSFVVQAVVGSGVLHEIESKKEYADFLRVAQEEEQWVLLSFYAPWCSFCKRLTPVLEEFATTRTSVRVAKIDATRHKGLATEHDVDGYPTMRFRVSAENDFRDFKGGRELEALEALDMRLRSPPVAQGLTWDQVTDRTDSILFALSPDANEKTLDIFQAVAQDRYHETSFVTTSETSKIKPGAVALIEKKNLEKPYYFPFDDLTKSSLKNWVKKHNAPLFASPLGPSLFRKVSAFRKVVIAVVDPNITEHNRLTTAVEAAIYQTNSTLREAFAAGWLDGNRWAQYVATFEVQTLPHLLVIDLPAKKFWNHDPSLVSTPEDILTHLTNIQAGLTPPRYQGIKGFPGKLKRFYLQEYFFSLNCGIAAVFLCIFLLIKFRPPPDYYDESLSSSSKKED